jgi:hypothetical protein
MDKIIANTMPKQVNVYNSAMIFYRGILQAGTYNYPLSA